MKYTWILIFAIALSGCSDKDKSSQQITERHDSSVVMQDSVNTVPEKPTEAVSKPLLPSNDKTFTSAQEAYDEGYLSGQQEGYTDATHHLDFGYSYNAEPEYSGFLQDYIEGYEAGYEDGFNEGLEENSEND